MLHTSGCEDEFKTFYKSLKNWAYLYLASSPEPGILGAFNQVVWNLKVCEDRLVPVQLLLLLLMRSVRRWPEPKGRTHPAWPSYSTCRRRWARSGHLYGGTPGCTKRSLAGLLRSPGEDFVISLWPASAFSSLTWDSLDTALHPFSQIFCSFPRTERKEA